MRRGLVWLLAVLVASATASCTSANQHDSRPTITSTYQPRTHPTTPTNPPPISTGANVRPGEKPPTLSPVGKTNTPLGADLFARYWIRTLDWGYATTDSSLAKAVFAASCTDCRRFIDGNFGDTWAKGWHFRGGRVSILESSAQLNDRRHGATSVVDVTISVGALETLDRADHVVRRAPAVARSTYRIWLRWAANQWAIVDWKEAVSR
jgi:hypothetical protein